MVSLCKILLRHIYFPSFLLLINTIKYRKVPKFLNTRKLCCNPSKIQEKRSSLWVFRQKYSNGIANSEDPDQTAPLGAV